MLFRIIALAELAVFYGCYVAKLVAQRKKGIRTNQLGKGKAGGAKAIEVALKVATYLVPCAELVSIALGTAPLPFAARVVGAVLGAVGTAVFVTSVVTMRDSWRAGVSPQEQTALVTDGIYRLSRNPAFLGFDLVYAAMALLFCNWPLVALSVIAAALIHLQIVLVEEPFLRKAFGTAYAEYQKKTRRYI